MHFRERLWATPWIYLSCLLIVPATLIVMAPINWVAGIVAAIVLYGACALFLTLSAPVVEIDDTELRAGRAHIPLALIGEATPFAAAEASHERGPGLDARAWLLIRGWVKPVVKVVIDDPEDPTPYWLISSRHPVALTTALRDAKHRTETRGAEA